MSALNTPEFYKDLVQTTVAAGGYTAGSGVLNVVSTALPFSQTQQMHVTTVDKATFAVKNVLKLTALNSSTQWAVIADSSNDGNANAEDIVRLSLTEKAMDQLIADMNQEGTYANLPSTTGQRAGNRYRQTDGPYEWRFNGSVWVPAIPGVGKVTLPLSSGWSWDNQGASTANNTYGALELQMPRNGAGGRMYYRTAPSTPYTVDFYLKADFTGWQSSGVTGTTSGAGVGFRDGSGKWQILFPYYDGSYNITVGRFSAAVFSAHESGALYTAVLASHWLIAFRTGIWLRIADNGTNLSYSLSLDGQSWISTFSHSRTSFMASGPTQYGVMGYIVGDQVEMNVMNVYEH